MLLYSTPVLLKQNRQPNVQNFPYSHVIFGLLVTMNVCITMSVMQNAGCNCEIKVDTCRYLLSLIKNAPTAAARRKNWDHENGWLYLNYRL